MMNVEVRAATLGDLKATSNMNNSELEVEKSESNNAGERSRLWSKSQLQLVRPLAGPGPALGSL
jgi:hypothetical protein